MSKINYLDGPSNVKVIADFNTDYERLLYLNDLSSISSLQQQQLTQPAASSSDSPIMPNITREAAVGGGPKAARIYQVAKSLVGTSNTDYYADSRVACASFVSTVLIKAGIMPQGSFTTSSTALIRIVEMLGAVNIFSGVIPASDQSILKAQAGDIVQLSSGGIVRHSGIATGEQGNIIATASSAGHVGVYRMNYEGRGGRAFTDFQLHRFGG